MATWLRRSCARLDKTAMLRRLTETEHEAMGQGSELRITERLSLRVFLFVVIHSTCKHALRKESTIKRSVDDLELFDDQRRKSARIMI